MDNFFFTRWMFNKESEIDFWDEFFRTKGNNYPGDFEMRMNPDLPIEIYHRAFIDHLPQDRIKILDVGAGPLTIIGKKHPSKVLEIVPIDALAAEYDILFEKYKISPLVRTIFAYTERLSEKFPKNWFDFSYARNSLDHSYDPFKGIIQMLCVTKEGHYVCLNHFEKEGELSGYHGLHQWNFYVKENSLFLSGPSMVINVTDELAFWGDFVHLEKQGRWIIAHVQKRFGVTPQQIEDISLRHAERMRVYRPLDIEKLLSNQRIKLLLKFALRRFLLKTPTRNNRKLREMHAVPIGLPRLNQSI